MPKDANLIDELVEGAAPSPALENDDLAGTAPLEGGQQQDAASSAVEGEGEFDTLSLVRDVVDKSRGTTTEATPATGVEGKGAAAQGQVDEENFTDVPFHTHPRFKQVLGRMKSAEQDAGRYRNVESFLTNSGLAPNEAADGLQIMALAKSDPVEAWKRLAPWVEQVAIAAGEILPQELVAQIQAGTMSTEVAMQISRSNAAAQSAAKGAEFRQQIQERQQKLGAAEAVNGAITNWESQRMTRDPNFDAKRPQLEREILWLQRTDGMPQTEQQVLTQLNKAYANVNKSFKAPVVTPQQQRTLPVRGDGGRFQGQIQPQQRREIKPVVGGQARANTEANDTSIMGIIKNEVSKRHAAA